MAMTKVKNLQLWCKKMTDGYRDVDIKDMTSSWKNGLAFCALIHRFRPDLIDYDSLSKENVFENNQLAFDVAEKELNIPAFLDAPDMVAIKVPDRLSVVTYVSQYYNTLHDKPQLGGPGVKKAVATKRHQETEPAGPDAKRLTPSHLNTHTPSKERQVSMGDKCHICGDKVYLMERHVEKNKLYHRHCFRHSDLSPTSKVFNKLELKKISDRVKSENEANKQTKTESDASSQPNFWKRRNEARKVEQMDTEDTSSSKETTKQTKGDTKTFLSKDVKGKHIDKTSDINKKIISTENKKDRPDDLKLESKTEVKKSSDLKPLPRKHKVEKTEPMDTSELDNFKLKPVPSPRNIISEKETSPVNGFLGKRKDKSPSQLLPQPQKLSTNRDVSPLSPPPPLPSQPPPSHLVKSELLSPHVESDNGSKFTSSADIKPSVIQGKKSPQFHSKVELSSPRSSHSTDSGSSFPISPRNTDSSSESSKISIHTKENKNPPKTQSKVISTNNGLSTSNTFVAQRTSNFCQPSKGLISNQRQISVDEALDITKNKGSHETVAVVFTPNQKQQEENEKQVLGGLLSNLANIRRKQKLSDASPTDDTANQRHSTNILDNHAKDNRGHVKSAILTNNLKDNDQSKNKKSSNNESHLKQKSKIEIESNIPEWKKQLEKNKNPRPKTVDLFSGKKDTTKSENENQLPGKHARFKTEEVKVPPRPKSVDILSEKNKSEQKPQWQIEAEKRMEARKGGYVDPEKTKISSDFRKDQEQKSEDIAKHSDDWGTAPSKPSRVNFKISDDKKESSNVQRRVLPTVPSIPDKADNKDKKKISVDMKFDFSQEEKSGKLKPPRPPPFSSGSPKSITHEKPSRPAPPLKDGDMKRLSPSEIQKQLTEIDSRLTELEIRGRQLEDSIRKVQEEDDDKMMVEWFELVNNKNELVRKEADLIYLSRAQELEAEQHEINRKLREMMEKDDINKTEEDKKEEEMLIQKLLDVVNQRNVIVDSIDEDRIRYEEEDKDIAMALKALSQDGGHVSVAPSKASYTKQKKKKKGKLL